MKTKDYVKKYSLDKGVKDCDFDSFLKDLGEEFVEKLNLSNVEHNYQKFQQVVSEINSKFEAINNKTLGCFSGLALAEVL